MNTNVKVNGKAVIAAATGIKFGSKGRVQPPAVLRTLAKGDRRAARKGLNRIGRVDLVLASMS